MTCPRCGHLNPEPAGWCGACGAALSPDQPTMTRLGGGSQSAPPGDRTMTGSGLASLTGAGRGFAPNVRLDPGTLLGTRYEILAVLGEGGMGTVYKAQDRELARLVALKVIRPEMAARPEVLERFKREIVLASQVTHRNVLRIHDLGEAGEIRFISMNFVEGANLKTVLERDGPMPLDRGLALARQIGEALQAAHDAGVVHRDLKPQNILIDQDGNALIADFGISRSLAEGGTMTDTGAILGTVDYMSPEQARGETPDHRGDIYSLGVMLYEMFTGALPFRAANALSVMMKRLHEDAPSIREARPQLPRWLAAAITRAMQRDPRERYQSAGALVRDLERQRASRSLRRFARPRYLVPVALLAVLAAAALILPRLPWPPWGASEAVPLRTSLVVLPFQNATGDPRYDWVRSGVPSLLRSEMIEARALRLVGEERVQDVLSALKVSADADPSPATSRRLAGLLGAENILSGRLVRIAERLRIDTTLLSAGAGTGGSGSSSSEGASIVVDGQGDQAIFAMVDSLSRQVQDRLGVGAGLLERRRGASELSTRSVEALSLYGEGLSLARSGNGLEAAKRLEAALGKDPEFHVARALLAETYDRLGYSDKAVTEAARAAAGVGSTSPYEAARIRAVHARLSGDVPSALKQYHELTRLAPNSAEAFFDLAAEQEDAGDLASALKSLERVILLDGRHPTAFYALGRVHYKLGQGAEAEKDFQTALSLDTETGNEEGKAAVLNGLGNTDRYLLSRRDEAIRNYQAALEIRQRIGDRRGAAATLRNLASMQRELGHYDEAYKELHDALAASQEIGDRAGLAAGHSELGDVYQDAGLPEKALQAYQESLKIVRDVDDPVILSRALSSVGYINSVLGRYVESFMFLKEALAKRREIGDKTEIVRSLVDIGLVEQVQGRYEEAIRYYTEGLGVAREIGDKVELLILQANLSNVHEDQGEYGSALALLDEARGLAREADDRTLVATVSLYAASVRQRLGDFPGAETALAEGLRLSRDMNNAPLLAEGLTTQAALHLERDQRPQALSAAKEAVTQARAAHDQRLILLARLQLAGAGGNTRDLEEIARTASTDGLAPIEAAAHLLLARAHLAAGRTDAALREAQQTSRLAGPLRERDMLFQAAHLEARALKSRRQETPAREAAARGLGFLEEMRQGLGAADLKIFLGRPKTSEFAREARGLFQGADGAPLATRLETLLRP